jgi:uncharacterized protein involved in exopolysaccharide biosynthesis
MAIMKPTPTTYTPRDRLERLVDYGRKAKRFWWLVVGSLVLGGALSVVFALTRPPKYKSWSILFFQERVQSSVLSGRQASEQQRNIGEKYRELLLSRDLLAKIVEDPELNAFPDELKAEGVDAAVEELRLAVGLEIRGANAFRITYTDTRPGRAQAVTARLTELLKAKEDEIRDDQVKTTYEFAENQAKAAREELRERNREYAEFIAKHPEFAQEDTGGGGAGVRSRTASNNQLAGAARTGNSRVQALERQRARIQARLDAPPGLTAPIHDPRPASPAQLARDQAVTEAKRELREAEKRLEDARAKYTDKHPDVQKAVSQVAAAKARVQRAEDAVAEREADPVLIAPTDEKERADLEKELARIEDQLAYERRRDKTPGAATTNDAVGAVVQLETQYAELRDGVELQRERVEALDNAVFRAQMEAQQQLGQQGAQLTVVDPAFRPVKPFGQGKKVIVLAGLVLFGAIGLAFAIGLAILDDRLYRRGEVEELGLAPVLAVIPPGARLRKRRKS